MDREAAILDLVRKSALQRGFDPSMSLLGEAVALRLYAKGASAHRAVALALAEAARMPGYRPGPSDA